MEDCWVVVRFDRQTKHTTIVGVFLKEDLAQKAASYLRFKNNDKNYRFSVRFADLYEKFGDFMYFNSNEEDF